jgi:hypothetical protein
MMTKNNRLSKVLILITLMLNVVACEVTQNKGNTKNKVTNEISNRPEIQTKVIFQEECPVSEVKTESFLGGLALAIIPSLVESGVKSLGNAIKKMGEDEPFTTSISKNVDFYSLDSSTNSFTINSSSYCMIIVRGQVNADKPTDSFTKSNAFSTKAKMLFRKYGLSDTPKFYYEATLVPSNDRSAFRVEPKFIFYGDHLGPKNSKNLVLSVGFGKPSAVNDSTFAIFNSNLSRNGKTYHINDSRLLEAYNSAYLPLPAVSSTASAAMESYKLQQTQLVSFKTQLLNLDKKEDPEISKLEKSIAILKELSTSKYVKAEIALNDAIALCEHNDSCNLDSDENILKLKQALENTKNTQELTDAISKIETQISERRTTIEASTQRTSISKAIVILESKISVAKRTLNQSTPVNVTATLTETGNGNKFLVSLGEAISGASGTVKEAVTTKLTPDDKEAELADTTTNLTTINTLRVNAITKVDLWNTKNTEYKSADDSTKVTLLPSLRIAYLQAKLDCDIAAANEVVEPICLTLEAPE